MARAIVVGAGPAGCAAVRALAARSHRVTWIDPSFTAGALSRYPRVPANTKVSVLWESLTLLRDPDYGASAGMAAVAERMKATATQQPHNPDPETIGWTDIGRCADIFTSATRWLSESPLVTLLPGVAEALTFDEASGQWCVERLRATPGVGVSNPAALRAAALVLASGCTVRPAPTGLRCSMWANAVPDHLQLRARQLSRGATPPRVLPVENALHPPTLRSLVSPDETVAVVGGGHTGLVLAKFLHEEVGVRRVILLARRPLRLAKWNAAAEGYDDWAFRGLKGESAEFAIRHGLVGLAPPPEGVVLADGRLELWAAASLLEDAELASSIDAVCYATGYVRAPLPVLTTRASAGGRERRIQVGGHAAPGGALLAPSGDSPAAPRLFGLGLAFCDDEFTSDTAYPAAGFAPFVERAEEVADAIAGSA